MFKPSAQSNARRGTIQTPHGVLETPFFMPIATKGAVKTLSAGDMETFGAQILLSNTYHLFLRPGLEILSEYGGLHSFMGWQKPILTDSGGYQVFSLAKRRKISEEGVAFASPYDGAKHTLTPERAMEIQGVIGSDIAMVLDECTPTDYTAEQLTASIDRTTRWAERSKQKFEQQKSSSNNPGAQLFGIVQGGVDPSLRKAHAEELKKIGFDGYAVGGLSVGEPFEDACTVLEALHPVLPADKPRYFMGGAKPEQIVAYVQRGIDMFDCVLPTRNARHGLIYRFKHDDLTQPDFYEAIHITNEKYKTDKTLILEDQPYTLGYVRHLFNVNEMLAYRLMTIANIRFYLQLMQKIRKGIEDGTL